MQREKVKYIGFYDSSLFSEENRNQFVSAMNKMDYIAQTLVALGKSVEIVSPSWTTNNKGYYHKRTSSIAKEITLTCGSTFGARKRLFRYLRILWSLVWLFGFLLRNTRVKEKIVVYHSLTIIIPVILAKKIRKFELVLEVEEIYQDVQNCSKLMKKKEYEIFHAADKYIFSTELLNEKLNESNKPYVICYGTYNAEADRNVGFCDHKLHVVYAGTLDPKKGGALIAVAAARFLPDNYHVHIIGFGSNEQLRNTTDRIKEINEESRAVVSYDGLLKGENYIKFLQSCHIGLSTQTPNAEFSNTSFPSKILSYLANGLRVVSVRIKAIERSAIGGQVFYYDKQDPEAVANTIINVDVLSNNDSREIIHTLDKKFLMDVKKLLAT